MAFSLAQRQGTLVRAPERSFHCERTQLLEPNVYIKAVKQGMKEEERNGSNNKVHVYKAGGQKH